MDGFCEDLGYDVLIEKDGNVVARGQETRIRQIDYSRTLDGVSTASIDIHVPSKDCAGQLAAVDHWNTTITVHHDGNELWHGPVLRPRSSIDSFRIEAIDLLGWMNKRVVRRDLKWTDYPIELIGRELFNHCVMEIDAPAATIHDFTTNITQSREALASQNRKGWAVLGEMLDTGLDVTTFGRQVLFGMPLFDTIHIDNRDVSGNVFVERDGDDMATWVSMDAQNDILGTYPEQRAGSNGFPLLEEILTDGQLTDAASAKKAAQERYEWSQYGVTRVRAEGGLQITPMSKLDPKTLICGQLINFTASDFVYRATETLRLGQLNVSVTGQGESATIELQPLGSYGNDVGTV